jgi:hypothetical protein
MLRQIINVSRTIRIRFAKLFIRIQPVLMLRCDFVHLSLLESVHIFVFGYFS